MRDKFTSDMFAGKSDKISRASIERIVKITKTDATRLEIAELLELNVSNVVIRRINKKNKWVFLLIIKKNKDTTKYHNLAVTRNTLAELYLAVAYDVGFLNDSDLLANTSDDVYAKKAWIEKEKRVAITEGRSMPTYCMSEEEKEHLNVLLTQLDNSVLEDIL